VTLPVEFKIPVHRRTFCRVQRILIKLGYSWKLSTEVEVINWSDLYKDHYIHNSAHGKSKNIIFLDRSDASMDDHTVIKASDLIKNYNKPDAVDPSPNVMTVI